MANRFAGPIRRGEIGSIEELKSRFKALAKETHPDLGAGEASAEAFAALRGEYEAALVDFDRHRFGQPSSKDGRGGPGSVPEGGNPFRPSRRTVGRAEFYVRLRELRRRGFPKLPRHEKERLRYEYRRYLVVEALLSRGEEALKRFEAFEAALLESEGPPQVLALFDGLVDHGALGQAQAGRAYERRRLLLEFGDLVLARDGGGEAAPGGQAARRLGEGLEGDGLLWFLALLVEDLGEASEG